MILYFEKIFLKQIIYSKLNYDHKDWIQGQLYILLLYNYITALIDGKTFGMIGEVYDRKVDL